jgi:hypothetical protein
MRMSIALPIAAALAAAAIGLSIPAAATTLNEALQLCNKTGGCTVIGRPGVGANITYKGDEIFCPYGGGQCTCLLCKTKRTEPADTGPKVGTGGVSSHDTTGGAPPPKGPADGGSTGTKVGAPPVVKSANQR